MPANDASVADGNITDATTSAFPQLIIEPDQTMTPIYNFVSSATKSIDVTMYEMTDVMFTDLLTYAAKKGIAVRVILDQNLEMSDNTAAYTALTMGGVQVHWANPAYASTHQKTITIDRATSAIMTLNFASIDYATSRDFAYLTNDAADVAAIETTFEADFTNAQITPPTATDLVWSPTNAVSSLTGIINGAKSSLLVENEEMSDDEVVEALASAAKRGVDVKIAMEDSTTYTVEFNELVAAGAKLATYSHRHLYIHAKIILADYGMSSAKAFLGSENFTYSSLQKNREIGLIVSNAAILAGLNTTLTSDFTGGTPYQIADANVPVDASVTEDASDDATSDDAMSDAAIDSASDAAAE
jgi:cardiolipin synthase